jgi:eukaryotic-like serine/threonine-protein kinase
MQEIDASRWKELSPLLDIAIDLSAPERETWLTTLYTTDPRTADDIRELLARDLESAETGTVTQMFRELLASETPDLVGRKIGDWTLTRSLGVGGMGSVWLADRSDGRFEGQAAVKFVNVMHRGATGVERFKDEGTALARLTHPNISRLLDAGVEASGQPYLILEYVDGIRIDVWCDEQRLTIAKRLEVFAKVCAAVEHAHSHRIIHRDLKPSNILVTHDGVVKLLDFGVARLVQQDPDQSSQAPLPFTPAYAAPEQRAGHGESTATDTFSLGVLLHVLLTGSIPASPAPPASGVAAVMSAAHAAARNSSPHAIASALRGDLDAILAAALAIDPARRYPSVAALIDDLQRLSASRPLAVRRGPMIERAAKFVRRNRLRVVAGGVAVLALATGTLVAVRQARESALQRARASDAQEQSRASSDMQTQMLAMYGPGGRALSQTERLLKARAAIELQYRNQPAILSSLLSTLSDQYADLNDLANQRELMFAAALAARRAENPSMEAKALCLGSYIHLQANQPDSAAMLLAGGMTLLPRARVDSSGAIIACNTARAFTHTMQQRFDSAAILTTQSIRLLEQSGDTLSTNYSTAVNNLGGTQLQAGRVRDAEASFSRLASILPRIGRENTDNMAVARGNQVAAIMAMGELPRALDVLRRELRRVQGVETVAKFPVIYRYRHYQILARAEQWDSVIAVTLPLVRDSLAQIPPVQYEAHLALTDAYLAKQQLTDARREWKAAMAWAGKAPPQPRLLMLRANISAAFLAQSDRIAPALDSIETFIRRVTKRDGGGDFFLFPALLRASQYAAELGDGPRALSFAQLALRAAAVDSVALTQSAFAGRAYFAEARAHALLRDPSTAWRSAEAARAPLRFGYGADHARVRELERWMADSLPR